MESLISPKFKYSLINLSMESNQLQLESQEKFFIGENNLKVIQGNEFITIAKKLIKRNSEEDMHCQTIKYKILYWYRNKQIEQWKTIKIPGMDFNICRNLMFDKAEISVP